MTHWIRVWALVALGIGITAMNGECAAEDDKPVNQVLNGVAAGARVSARKTNGTWGWSLTVYNNEQADRLEKFEEREQFGSLYLVREVTDQYIVLRSRKPVEIWMGPVLVERTIPLHAISDVVRYVQEKEE
jgi:hypothetical protein